MRSTIYVKKVVQMKKSILLILALLFGVFHTNAQSQLGIGYGIGKDPNARIIKIDSGSFESLKNCSLFLARFDYSNMTVGGDRTNETDFINNKANELNNKKPGNGDIWKAEWFEKRTSEYEPKFMLLFNKYAKSKNISCSKNYDAAGLIMTIHTTHTNIITYMGYSYSPFRTGIEYIPSYINAVITFTDSSTGKNVASFSVINFASESIIEAYAALGKYFAKYLVDHL